MSLVTSETVRPEVVDLVGAGVPGSCGSAAAAAVGFGLGGTTCGVAGGVGCSFARSLALADATASMERK